MFLIKFSDLTNYTIIPHSQFVPNIIKDFPSENNPYNQNKKQGFSNFGQLIQFKSNPYIIYNIRIQSIAIAVGSMSDQAITNDERLQLKRIFNLAKTYSWYSPVIKLLDFNNDSLEQIIKPIYISDVEDCTEQTKLLNFVRMISIPCKYGSLISPLTWDNGIPSSLDNENTALKNNVTQIQAHGETIVPIQHIDLPHNKELVFMNLHKYIYEDTFIDFNALPACSIKYDAENKQATLKFFHKIDANNQQLIDYAGLKSREPKYKDIELTSIKYEKINQNNLDQFDMAANYYNSYYQAICSYFYGVDIFNISKKQSVKLSQVLELLENDYNERIVISCCRGMQTAANTALAFAPSLSKDLSYENQPIYQNKELLIKNMVARSGIYDKLPEPAITVIVNYPLDNRTFSTKRINHNNDKNA